jgi:putative hydrolase of HD superfamily
MSLKRDLELLFEIGCFRFINRTWTRFLNVDGFQNNTEHSFRVAWIALTLAKHEKQGNHEKILKMALLHDLPESRTGDVDYLSRQYTKRDEALGAADMFGDTALQEEILTLLHEYEERKSIESKLVKDADNLDVDLELREQEFRGHRLKDVLGPSRKQAVYPKLFTKSAQRFWREIEKANPHDWHFNATRNRFRGGDWKKR